MIATLRRQLAIYQAKGPVVFVKTHLFPSYRDEDFRVIPCCFCYAKLKPGPVLESVTGEAWQLTNYYRSL